MNIRESIKTILREESKFKRILRQEVNRNGIFKTSKMMGVTRSKIVDLIDLPIDAHIANDLLFEAMVNGNLQTKYEEFEISVDTDGIFLWYTKRNTDHFLPNMTESLYVLATPFWDDNDFTPVDLDFYSLHDEDSNKIVEVDGYGDFYFRLGHESKFDNVKELFSWYKEFYLPTVYNIITTDLLPKMYQRVDDLLDERMGY